MTGPRLSCHCAGRLPRGLDVPHICDAWSDHHMTELRSSRSLPPAANSPGGRRVPSWLVAAVLITLLMVPVSFYGVLSASA